VRLAEHLAVLDLDLETGRALVGAVVGLAEARRDAVLVFDLALEAGGALVVRGAVHSMMAPVDTPVGSKEQPEIAVAAKRKVRRVMFWVMASRLSLGRSGRRVSDDS